MNMRAIFGGALAATLFAAVPAIAQSAPSAPIETKNIGDWEVRCFAPKSPVPCDMIYAMLVRKTGQMLLMMRIIPIPSTQDKEQILIGVPLEVSFAKGLVVSTDGGVTQPLPFIRCDRTGCYVSTTIENSALDTIARSSAAGTKVNFSWFNGKSVSLPFPLKGFSEARQAMADMAKGRSAGR